MLAQQKHVYVEVLNWQKKNFMSFTKLAMETTGYRIDGIRKQVLYKRIHQ